MKYTITGHTAGVGLILFNKVQIEDFREKDE
jgi:hypothetical protein